MIGKVKTGKSFGGCLRYNLDRIEAEIIGAEGVRITGMQNIINDFNIQRKLNPNLGKAVGHIILSWSAKDSGKLNSEIMKQMAVEYMEKMKIRDTQYLIVRHSDREHPHLHLVYNRVDNNGKTISDQFQRKRNVEVCKQMTLQHGFYLAKGKAEVKRSRLTGADKVKYAIHDTLRLALPKATSWQELEVILRQADIGMELKYRSGTQIAQGVSFSKDGLKFKGSEIERDFSFAKISQVMSSNLAASRQFVPKVQGGFLQASKSSSQGSFLESSIGLGFDVLSALSRSQHVHEENVPELKKKKKKSKGLRR